MERLAAYSYHWSSRSLCRPVWSECDRATLFTTVTDEVLLPPDPFLALLDSLRLCRVAFYVVRAHPAPTVRFRHRPHVYAA